jgi:hypothetical protein
MPELRLLHVLEPEAGGRRLSRATPRVAFGSCGGGSLRRPASGPSPAASSNLGESVEERRPTRGAKELTIQVDLGLVAAYSRSDDRAALIVEATALGEPRTTPEAVEVRTFAPENPWGELAL